MVLFKQIPKHLLPHEVTYQAPTSEGTGGMGEGSTPEPVAIKFVRFTPTRKKITLSDNSETVTNGVLYIDAVNSEPFLIPNEGGEIAFQGSRLSIVSVSTFYTTTDKPHHVEVMLQ